ncbi:MAG: response regulator transcription factor [Acidimicrobiales bacterium]
MNDAADVPVLIVDDQAAFRSAARTVVSLLAGFAVAAEAESGEQALEVAPTLGPALVLMDINLGGLTGIEATRRLTTDHPDLVVVLMSTYTEADLPADARQCGAAAYLHKEDLAPDVLRDLWVERHPVGS